MAEINKETLEYLAQLAKIELKPQDETKLLKDLGEILNYFKQLKEVDTSNVEPMTGGTFKKNVFRNDVDDLRSEINATAKDITDAFPEKENGFLKVPPVFEQ